MRRIEASLQDEPDRCVLVSVPDGCALEQLRELISSKLGLAPGRLLLGQALILDPDDLRDGDKVTCVRAKPASTGPEPCSLLQQEPTQSRWYPVIHALLTLVIFICLSELFQRFVFKPWFHADLDDDAPPKIPTSWPQPQMNMRARM